MKDYYFWLKELAQYAIATCDFELSSSSAIGGGVGGGGGGGSGVRHSHHHGQHATTSSTTSLSFKKVNVYAANLYVFAYARMC